jgi:hypothetical protein
MTASPKYKFLASALMRMFAAEPETTPEDAATSLGYKSPFIVQNWLSGHSLPDLTRLVALVNEMGWPLEDFVSCWCADQAPEHADRFAIIAAQFFGLDAAENLLSCADANDGPAWLTMVGEPMTAAEVALELEQVPMGSYRDNRRL